MPRDPVAALQTDPDWRRDTCLNNSDLYSNLLFNREAVYQTFGRPSPIEISAAQAQTQNKSGGLQLRQRIVDSIDAVGQAEDMPPKDASITVRTQRTGNGTGKGTSRDLKKNPPRISSFTPSPFARDSHLRTRPASKHRTSARNGSRLSDDDQDFITRSKVPAREVAAQTRSKTKSKRSTSGGDDVERPSKVFKSTPKANSSKRVNGTGASLGDAFVISDDGGEIEKPEYHHRTESLAPLRRLKIGTPASDDDLKPSSFLTPNQMCNFTFDLDLARIEAAHAKELADLQRRLDASKAEGRKIKDEAKQACVELQRRQDATHDKEKAVLTEQLDDERLKCSNLSTDGENLRRQLADSQASLKGEAKLKQERDEIERLYKEQQIITGSLNRENSRRRDTAHRKEQDLTTQIKSLTTELDLLKQEATQLQRDNATLKAVQSSQPSLSSLSMLSIPPSLHDSPTPLAIPFPWPLTSLQPTTPSLGTSPTPLSTPTSSTIPLSQTPPTAPPSPPAQPSDHRLTNMRRTYIALKKKHDMLSSAATNLATLTRGWDHAAFGEFGRGLRQLAAVLGEEAGTVGIVGTVEVGVEKRDEEDGKGG